MRFVDFEDKLSQLKSLSELSPRIKSTSQIARMKLRPRLRLHFDPR